MRTHLSAPLFAYLVVLLAAVASPGLAYEIESHARISEEATQRSSVDKVLKQSLGMAAGVNQSVSRKRLIDWVQDGSRRADSWTFFFNHFHNPLIEDWSQAGFSGFPPGRFTYGLSTGTRPSSCTRITEPA